MVCSFRLKLAWYVLHVLQSHFNLKLPYILNWSCNAYFTLRNDLPALASVRQMCNTFLTAIAKTVSDQPTCCASSHRPISRSCCWQQSYCMFGLMALHSWFNPSLMCAHIPPGCLGKVSEVHTSEQGGRWQLWHWNESAPTKMRKWEKPWKRVVNLGTEANRAGILDCQRILRARGQILSKTTP